MLRTEILLFCVTVFVLDNHQVKAKFYPTETGVATSYIGSGLEGAHGQKYTNVGYDLDAPLGHHGLGGLGYGYRGVGAGYEEVPYNIGYGQGFVGIPKATGLIGTGYSHEIGVGPKGTGLGIKGSADLGQHVGDLRTGYYYPGSIGGELNAKSFGGGYGTLGYGREALNLGVGYGQYPGSAGISHLGGHSYEPATGIGYNHLIESGRIGIPSSADLSGGYARIGGLGYGKGHVIGGSEIEKNSYGADKKNIIGEHYLKNQGHQEDELKHGDAGYSTGQLSVKDAKADSLHFSDVDGVNQAHQTGKAYHTGEHFDKEGKNRGEQVAKEGHKKGHNIKSFKTSHHLDESGKSEEFYDEDHDEGGNYAFDGHSGKFGETEANFFKGGHQDDKYSSQEAKKDGHFDEEYVVDKAHAGTGNFGGKKYAQNEETYGVDKGNTEHDLTGHHVSNNFFKKYPTY